MLKVKVMLILMNSWPSPMTSFLKTNNFLIKTIKITTPIFLKTDNNIIKTIKITILIFIKTDNILTILV